MAKYEGNYSEFNALNRLENLDGIEWKIVDHLINSNTKHANLIWKILKYDSDIYALNKDPVDKDVRRQLVCTNNGEHTKKRLFLQPFVDDAWSEQCSSVYIYVDELHPVDQTRANVIVTVEAVVHAKTSVIAGDGQQITIQDPTDPDKKNNYNPNANPNDSDKQGNIVVTMKNRATVLLKSIIAELNGLYLDGVGYLLLDKKLDAQTGAKLSLWNNRSYYGYSIKLCTTQSGVSDSADIGF